MKALVSAAIGAALGFAGTLLAIGSAVLLAAGIGGGILVRQRPGTVRVLNFDPSDVVIRAVAVGAAALGVGLVFVGVYLNLRRQERRRATAAAARDVERALKQG
jgi:hypothetical protein